MFGPEDERNLDNEYVVSLNSEDTISNMGINSNGFWKYNEDKILKQLEEYIASTYR